jgi:hypothetical protein
VYPSRAGATFRTRPLATAAEARGEAALSLKGHRLREEPHLGLGPRKAEVADMVDPEAVLLPGTELAEGVGADTDLEWVGDLRADHADRPARRARGSGVRLEDSDLRIALDQVDRRGHAERAGADDHDVGFEGPEFSASEG